MTTTSTTSRRSSFRLPEDWRDRIADHYPTMILIVLVVVASLSTDAFLTQNNLTNLLSQLAVTGIIVLAELVVVISGNIDISVGSVLGLASVFAAGLFDGSNVWLALVVAIATGAALGMVNGTLIAFRAIDSFIVTLGMLALARGLVYWYTHGSPVTPKDVSFLTPGTELIGDIPVIALFWLAAGLIVTFLLRRTVFGRRVYAIGSSKQAATSSGMPVRGTVFMVFVLSGALCGLAGFLLASRVGAGTPSAGTSYELDAIAAVVIGGARLTGGHGRVFGAVVGTFIFGVITNLLALLDVSTFLQDAFKGALILIAISIASGRRNENA
jgi:ribose/xylose/arabinose/galactoside ABC-type transport system permease subunit